MVYAFICRRCGDLPVATCCRVIGESTSGFYAWRAYPVARRDWDHALLTNTIVDVHRASPRSYGSPRVHAELHLGRDIRCGRKRVERLMRQTSIAGVHRRARAGAAPVVIPPPRGLRTWSSVASTHPSPTACG